VQGQGAQLVWVDATDPVNEGIAAQFQVQGFPSIFVFPGGAPKVCTNVTTIINGSSLLDLRY